MIDFKSIISCTDRYNFHSHTQFCDGRFPMSDFAEAAVAAGFRHYGFSPHSPVPIDSPCNMAREVVPEYFAEVERLRAIYGQKINFYCSMEIDYLGPDWGPSHPYFRDLPLDYRIGSIHFIPDKNGRMIDVDGSPDGFRRKMEESFEGDIRYVVDKFYDRSIEMVIAGGFDIIGHFDKIGYNASVYSPGIEKEAWYDRRVSELVDAILDSGVVVEINTKSRETNGRFFPAERYWRRLLDNGVTIVVNSDAHYPALIDASRGEALSMLQALS